MFGNKGCIVNYIYSNVQYLRHNIAIIVIDYFFDIHEETTMFTALDINGVRIGIEDTKTGTVYKCPLCNCNLVIKKNGILRAPHFAHRSSNDETVKECVENYKHSDMSFWHYDKQLRFPPECREVWFEDKAGNKHRADIFLKSTNVIVEIQHSKLSVVEFERRNSFYNEQGYSVVWLFDFDELLQKYSIDVMDSYIDCSDDWKCHYTNCFTIKRIEGIKKILGDYNPLIDMNVVVYYIYNHTLYKIKWVDNRLTIVYK